jgi:hypothetical protein
MESHLVRKAVASGLSKAVAVNPANGPTASCLLLRQPVTARQHKIAGYQRAVRFCTISS